MAKIEASTSPEDGAPPDDAAALARPDEPTRLVEQGAGQSKRQARDLDDNWALSASLAVPRVTGVTDVAPDPEGATVPSPEAPTVAAGSAPRQPLSRAALRLLAGKTIQGVAPVVGQRRPAEAAGTAAVETRPADAPMYLEEGPRVLRLSTETSEVSVPEIDAGTSATTVLPPERAASPYHSGARDSVDDSGIGELADPPPPVVSQHADTLDEEPEAHSAPVPVIGQALAGMPPPALKAPTAVSPAIALGGARRPYANELVGEGGHREADWFEPSGGVAMAGSVRSGAHFDHSFSEGVPRRSGASRLTLPLLVFAAVSAVVFAGAYVYSRGRASPAIPAPSAPEPSAASAPAADDSAAGLVDVRFDSNPPGASVVLLDREHGLTSAVGTTPVRAAIDARAKYDAIFTLEGHATRLLRVSTASPHVRADFTAADPQAVAAARESGVAQVAVAPPPTTENPPATEKGPAAGEAIAEPPLVAATEKEPPVDPRGKKDEGATPDKRDGGKKLVKRVRPKANQDEEEDEDPTPTVDPSAIGKLSISTKPPCQVLINGKPAGTTPVRDLSLPAGIYRITVVNKEIGINETLGVRVTAGKETKVAQDYTGSAE